MPTILENVENISIILESPLNNIGLNCLWYEIKGRLRAPGFSNWDGASGALEPGFRALMLSGNLDSSSSMFCDLAV